VDPNRFAYRTTQSFFEGDDHLNTGRPHRFVTGSPEVAKAYLSLNEGDKDLIDIYDSSKFKARTPWTQELGVDTLGHQTKKRVELASLPPKRSDPRMPGANSPIYERVVSQGDLDRSHVGQMRVLPSGTAYTATKNPSAVRLAMQNFGKSFRAGDHIAANPHIGQLLAGMR